MLYYSSLIDHLLRLLCVKQAAPGATVQVLSQASKDIHALYHVFLIPTSSPPTHNIFHAANVHRSWGDSSQETHAIFTLADTAATNALQLLGVGDPVKQGSKSKPKPSNKRGSGGNKAGPAKKAKNSRAQPGGTRSSGSSSTTSRGRSIFAAASAHDDY